MDLIIAEAVDSPTTRRFSGLPSFLANVGGAIVRVGEAAGTLLTDPVLRSRGTSVIASGASKGIRGIQHGTFTTP